MTKTPTAKELADLNQPSIAHPTGTEGADNGIVVQTGDIINETSPKQPNNVDAPPQVIGQTPGETPRAIFASPQPTKAEKQVKVVLDADYWPEDGDRRSAGSSISIPMSKAKELLQTGKAHIPMAEDDR